MNIRRKNLPINTIVQASLFIALALVVRNISYMVYFGGAAGMRISFSGVFTKITAILFGPFFGGTASGIVDIIGFILKPEGAYIPMLTVTAVLSGVISGVLWRATKDIDIARFQGTFLILTAIIGVIGIINHITVSFYSNSVWGQVIKKLGKYKDFASIGLEVIAIIGMIFLIVSFIVKKACNKSEIYNDFLKVLFVTGFSGIFVTTLNTYILQVSIPELRGLGFAVFWVPRVIQEVFMTVVQAYIVSLLLAIYRRSLITLYRSRPNI